MLPEAVYPRNHVCVSTIVLLVVRCDPMLAVTSKRRQLTWQRSAIICVSNLVTNLLVSQSRDGVISHLHMKPHSNTHLESDNRVSISDSFKVPSEHGASCWQLRPASKCKRWALAVAARCPLSTGPSSQVPSRHHAWHHAWHTRRVVALEASHVHSDSCWGSQVSDIISLATRRAMCWIAHCMGTVV